MREGWPSLTALAVAIGRGIGTAPNAIDDSARYLVPSPIGRVLEWLGEPTAPRMLRTALRLASLGIVDHVSLRRAAIDTALIEAVDTRIPQLVVLGAGLDGRAWRLDELRDVTVFEIDHPATQAGKQRRVHGRPTLAADLHFVAVDFEHDDLGARLAEAGHDPELPTVWIWEGVTPYLHPPAIEASLAAIARCSAPTSRLLVSYAVPQMLPWNSRTLQSLAQTGFALLGEPLRGAMDTSALINDLAAHGFVVLADSNNRDWARLYEGNATLAIALSSERLMVAERIGARH